MCVCVFLIDSVCVRGETASAAAEARSQSHYLGTIWMVMALQRPFHAIPWLDPSRLGHQIDFAEAFLCPKILRMNFVRLGVKQTSTSASLISPRRACTRVGVASPTPSPSPSRVQVQLESYVEIKRRTDQLPDRLSLNCDFFLMA